jgi:hypothetical protein
MIEQRKEESMQDTHFIARQMGKVTRGLQVLNDDLAKSSALGKSKWRF